MSNLQKRIYTSLIIFPLSVFLIIKGGFFLSSFLFIVFLAANYELFSAFSNKKIILFLNLVLIVALFSISYLRFNIENKENINDPITPDKVLLGLIKVSFLPLKVFPKT